MPAAPLQILVDDLLRRRGFTALTILCRSEPRDFTLTVPEGVRVNWICGLQSADELDLATRADAAIVFDQLEHLPDVAGLALLARLRDCHCDEILLVVDPVQLTGQEMLSLGFVERSWDGPGKLFHYRRDRYYESRSWNTPEQWAHPENFTRIRW